MTKAAYYKFDLVLTSALSIGGADSFETDVDVVRDSRGLPVIPGTSIAGVMRSYFSEEEADELFGKRLGNGDDLTESKIKTFDATWADGNESVSVRDGVSLENRVAKRGLKFDRQIVERGARFHTHLEISDADDSTIAAVEEALGALNNRELRIGAKTTRGLGCVEVDNCTRRLFDFDQDEEAFNLDSPQSWLNFNPFEPEWVAGEPVMLGGVEDKNDVVITLGLKQRGALSIREYSTDPGRPDFSQLHVRDNRVNDATGSRDVPLIPGTSWAGAFRDCYRRASSEEETEKLFGYVKKVVEKDSKGNTAVSTQTRRSRITFSETEMAGGSWKEVTRNSIDRFTAGTKDKALFTMRTYYGGASKSEDQQTMLYIRVQCKGETWSSSTFRPLIIAIADMHNGFLPVGGLAGVGHGMFEVTGASCKVCGDDLSDFESNLLKSVKGLPECIAPDVQTIAEQIKARLQQSRALTDDAAKTEESND